MTMYDEGMMDEGAASLRDRDMIAGKRGGPSVRVRVRVRSVFSLSRSPLPRECSNTRIRTHSRKHTPVTALTDLVVIFYGRVHIAIWNIEREAAAPLPSGFCVPFMPRSHRITAGRMVTIEESEIARSEIDISLFLLGLIFSFCHTNRGIYQSRNQFLTRIFFYRQCSSTLKR